MLAHCFAVLDQIQGLAPGRQMLSLSVVSSPSAYTDAVERPRASHMFPRPSSPDTRKKIPFPGLLTIDTLMGNGLCKHKWFSADYRKAGICIITYENRNVGKGLGRQPDKVLALQAGSPGSSSSDTI